MRAQIRQMLWKLVKTKWFWITVILLFILAIILDVGLAIVWIVQTLIFTAWNPVMFWLGLTCAVLGALTARKKIFENKQLKEISKIVFLIVAVMAFTDYGFWKGLVFLIGIMLLGRILGWITPKNKVLKRVS